ncbi:uncharacterized protein [Triticum aestivum]|uniref:uncharacterized protein n=1 Tax=Triticum aestivum TaxID=4565 RepID=UPI001D0153CB|nr:uncharacterized protein LOC123064350 [Triticum aestivum]
MHDRVGRTAESGSEGGEMQLTDQANHVDGWHGRRVAAASQQHGCSAEAAQLRTRRLSWSAPHLQHHQERLLQKKNHGNVLPSVLSRQIQQCRFSYVPSIASGEASITAEMPELKPVGESGVGPTAVVCLPPSPCREVTLSWADLKAPSPC